MSSDYSANHAPGAISSRGPGTTGARRQAEALETEGLTVQETRTGQFRVNFAIDGWFPATIADATSIQE